MAFGVNTTKVPTRLRSAMRDNLTVDLFTPDTVSRIPIDLHKECPKPDYSAVRITLIGQGNVKLMLADETIVHVPIAQIGGIRTKLRVTA